jgi:hypothetical protein
MMTARPQTVGYGLSDSPIGLAAWMYHKFAQVVAKRGHRRRSRRVKELLGGRYVVPSTSASVRHDLTEMFSDRKPELDVFLGHLPADTRD